MDLKTEITIQAMNDQEKYDASVKKLFSNREIIAPVLKEVVSEYRDSTYDEIIHYIDPGSIRTEPVDDVSVLTQGNQTEMSSVSDKLIRYDTRFKAINPKLTTEELYFYLHIDIEVQNDYKPSNPSYPIIKRAVYYGAREISGQLGVLTEETNYDRLQKAYSIWICNENIPMHLQNTVTRYSLTRQDLIGHCDEPTADYDLLEIIMIRRGNNEGQETIFDYLTGIFTSNMARIKDYLGETENYDRIRTEVKAMSGLGESIATKNYNSGMLDGICIGRDEGIIIGEVRGRNEGISIGRNEGISIGEARGRSKGQEDLINKILALKMLTPEQVEQLRKM